MGILNVTPDSFSDGGRFLSLKDAVEHAFRLVDEGADILDVGGESSRPGSLPIPASVEMDRIVPLIIEIAPSLSIPISVDTCKWEVAEVALDAGAQLINDICGLSDERMVQTVMDRNATAIVMHMHGTPETLATDLMRGDAMSEIKSFFDRRMNGLLDAGIRKENLIVDPGIGFGKTSSQDMEILSEPKRFGSEYPVLIGHSRKRFLSHGFPDASRDEATHIASIITSDAGADIIRVHDVNGTRNALLR